LESYVTVINLRYRRCDGHVSDVIDDGCIVHNRLVIRDVVNHDVLLDEGPRRPWCDTLVSLRVERPNADFPSWIAAIFDSVIAEQWIVVGAAEAHVKPRPVA
jgi:hypothetical protein